MVYTGLLSSLPSRSQCSCFRGRVRASPPLRPSVEGRQSCRCVFPQCHQNSPPPRQKSNSAALDRKSSSAPLVELPPHPQAPAACQLESCIMSAGRRRSREVNGRFLDRSINTDLMRNETGPRGCVEALLGAIRGRDRGGQGKARPSRAGGAPLFTEAIRSAAVRGVAWICQPHGQPK